MGNKYGLYESNDSMLIMLNYGSSVFATIAFFALVINIEFGYRHVMSTNLKDKYSHELGNILQAIYTSLQLLKKNTSSEIDKIDLIDLSEGKCLSAAEFLKNIKKL